MTLLLRGFSTLVLLSAATLLGSEVLLAALVASPDDAVSFPEVALELEDTPPVTELEGVSFSTETGLEEVSSQLAQKNPAKASTIFFQCLYNIFSSVLFYFSLLQVPSNTQGEPYRAMGSWMESL